MWQIPVALALALGTVFGIRKLQKKPSNSGYTQPPSKPLTPDQKAMIDQLHKVGFFKSKSAKGNTPEEQKIINTLKNSGVFKQKASNGKALPHLMQGDPLHSIPGHTYWTTLVLHVPSFMAPGRDQIIQETQNHGFEKVEASSVKPKDWPGKVEGDWYVKAVASRPNELPRKKGVAETVEAFEG